MEAEAMANEARNFANIEYDRDKVEEMVLALLWLTLDADGQAWKSHDWGVLDWLHERGYISDPKSKAMSVLLTKEGQRRAGELFAHHFGVDGQQ